MKKFISILMVFSMLCSIAISCSFAAETAKKENSLILEAKSQTESENSDLKEIAEPVRLALLGAASVVIGWGIAKLGYVFGYSKGWREGNDSVSHPIVLQSVCNWAVGSALTIGTTLLVNWCIINL